MSTISKQFSIMRYEALNLITALSFLFFIFLQQTAVVAFEESIFEDEDIYAQALPPVPHTGLTAPGTKWCGPGNTSTSYDDLGLSSDTDKCCRSHDYCDDILEAQSTLHGLINNDWFPIMHCKCEQQFINCLQSVNSMISNTLGRIYFGTRGNCMDFGYPIVTCKDYQRGTFRKRCIRYQINKTMAKKWQLYDIPFYSKNN